MKFLQKNYLQILIIFFAICGFVAAFTLSVEKLHILENPNQILPCDINSVFNCQTVMKSPYANIGDVPYSFLGVAGYPAVILAGLFLIQSTKTNKIVTWALSLGSFAAFALSTWFMYISSWVIGVFCPWCLVSAVSSTAIFFLFQTIFLQNNSYGFSKKANQKIQNFLAKSYNVHVTIAWYLFIFALSYLPFIIAQI